MLSKKYLKSLSDFLRAVEYKSEAWCLRHKRCCPVSPRSDPKLRDACWIEAAGSMCTPWSLMGARDQWLSPCTLVCLVWAFAMKFFQPDAIIHECTPDFPHVILKRIFETPGGPKCVQSTPHTDKYECKTLLFTPVALGTPSHRLRRYTIFILVDMASLEYFSTETDFFRIFQSPCPLNALPSVSL